MNAVIKGAFAGVLNGRLNLRQAIANFNCLGRSITTQSVCFTKNEPIDYPDYDDIVVPSYQPRQNEPLAQRKARLLYQSRKRGMLENGLLLSTFADKYLAGMTESQVEQYDNLINLPSNDWDLFYWATGVKPTPSEFDTEMMNQFKLHVKNLDKEQRIMQPPLTEESVRF